MNKNHHTFINFVLPSVVFVKFASYSVVILTIQKPDSYSALASSLVRVGRSYGKY